MSFRLPFVSRNRHNDATLEKKKANDDGTQDWVLRKEYPRGTEITDH